MKKMTTVTSSVLAALIAQAVVPFALPTVASAEATETALKAKSAGEVASLDEAKKMNLSLLIAATVVEQKFGKLAQIDQNVFDKYNKLRKYYLASVPVSALGVGVASGGIFLSNEVKFLSNALTAIARASGDVVIFSGKKIARFSVLTGIDVVLEKSYTKSHQSSTYVFNHFIEPLIPRHAGLSSAVAGGASVLGGSLYLFANEPNDVMSREMVRDLLGQSSAVRSRIDVLTNDMSAIFNLNSSQQAMFKTAMYDTVIEQSVKNKFSQDPKQYSLDAVKVMESQQIISKDQAEAVTRLRSILTDSPAADTPAETVQQAIEANVDSILDLASVLESYVNSTDFSNDASLKKELTALLGGAVAKLRLIGYSLKK